ncbi:MAG: TIGR01777 family oxidoreductase [Thermodesulfobacteriota bacterium]|nr:TIGR01777 family oxidoreductase [Thermodesulfobacteriota bacterium]
MTKAFFSRSTTIDADVAMVFAWHARQGAIERLSPPWDPLTVLRRTGGIREGAEVDLKMKSGPFSYVWRARHTVYEKNNRFVDEQVSGPFALWQHAHLFHPADGNRCRIEDRITFRLPFSFITHPFLAGLVRRQLERIFAYRHRVTATDIQMHRAHQGKPRKTVLISGAGGVIGSALVPFLTTGGHHVCKLVRREPAADNEIFWDPARGAIDRNALEAQKIDAVIHLAGENVGEGRWTARKKRVIMESRTSGTALLVEALAGLKDKPAAFLSASAIGIYGHRGNMVMTESDVPGEGFLASVCENWEAAASAAKAHGIRTVLMRIGVVMTPAGGALQRLLPLFRAGLGGPIGSGRQYVSWIVLDDAIGAIYHLLMNPEIEGPVNLVAPEPLKNRHLSRSLAQALRRPAVLPVPSIAVKAAFGEMGREAVLSSTRVVPEKLQRTGYAFKYPELKNALAHLLGRTTQ